MDIAIMATVCPMPLTIRSGSLSAETALPLTIPP
jgi:hypothetical protein